MLCSFAYVQHSQEDSARPVLFELLKVHGLLIYPSQKTSPLQNHLSRKAWNIKNDFIQFHTISIYFHPPTISTMTISQIQLPHLCTACPELPETPETIRHCGESISHRSSWGMAGRHEDYTWNSSLVSPNRFLQIIIILM